MIRPDTISRSVLSDLVKDHLLRAILDGRFAPGARIIETRVARELGTSQAPVREALRDLEALGVVETLAFRGARVRRPSAAELLEAFVVRAELESLAARLAIPNLKDGDLDGLAELIEEMRRCADAGDAHAEALADAGFHKRIIELSGNSTLVRVWRTLEPFSRTYITLGVPGADRRRIADQHSPVLAALQARDADLADSVLRRHFEEAGAGLASRWADEAQPAAPRAGRPRAARTTAAATDTDPATERTA
jgi:DNA-binding GntR family transcriptional regulator